MNLSLIQTELVACALCEADGKNPDAEVAAGNETRLKAWQTYETEARRFIVAAEALNRWSQTLNLFRTLTPGEDGVAASLQAT